MSSLKEIEERQKRMYALIDQMTAEEDMTRMLQYVQQIEGEARELEAAANAFQNKMDKQFGKQQKGGFEVVLTAEQRARILKATNVNMMSVIVEDAGGTLMGAMPTTSPEQIEAIALKQAKEKKLVEEAEMNSRNQAERMLKNLEAQNELVAAKVKELREDPKFREALGLDPKKR